MPGVRIPISPPYFYPFSGSWRGVREAEGARLEIVCRLIPYRGFESHPLRHCGRVPYNKPRKPRQVREEAAVADSLCVAVSPAFLIFKNDRSKGEIMKKIFFVFVFLSAFALNGAELFYSNGTSVSVKKADEFSAVKTSASQAAGLKNVFYRMNTGHVAYSFMKGNSSGLPIYFLGNSPVIAERRVFWRGEKPVEYMEEKYGMKLAEIFPTYPLYAFSVQADSVEISEKIVKNGDGYAFPDLVSETRFYSEQENEPGNNDKEYLDFVPESWPEDPYFDVQWHLQNNGEVLNHKGTIVKTLKNADIKFIQALEFLNSNGIKVNPNTKIAIMDTGVITNHEDLTNIETGYDALNKTDGGYPDPAAVTETPEYARHGTNCAGVSAGVSNEIGITGVCPWCRIYPVRWLSGGAEDPVWSDSDMITVYEKYVADPDIATINCSFGPKYSDGIAEVTPGAVEAVRNFMQNGRGGKGGVVVHSSGNNSVNASYKRYFEYDFTFERNGAEVTDRVIAVNASSAWDTRVEYSNFGYVSTVAAPSKSQNMKVGIATTTLRGYGTYPSDGQDYTLNFSGTSAAAPIVSGLFGVLFSVNPGLTLEEAVDILKQSADKINPETGFWDENGFSVKYGYGRVNLEKAVRLAVGEPMCAEVREEECGNHLDDDCDGYVDEGCAEELTAGKPCETASDCTTDSLTTNYVRCVKKFGPFVFKEGYCFIRSTNYVPCPDGTKSWDLEDNIKFCALECNSSHPCERSGYYCSDEILGICLPRCSDNSDCTEGYICGEDGKCAADDEWTDEESDKEEPEDADETANIDEIPDNEEISDTEDASDNEETPDSGEVSDDTENSDSESVVSDEDAVENYDSSEEPVSDDDTVPESEKKKNGGGCSVLAL